MSKYTKEIMASFIDHTLLKPDASKQEILHICEEAKQYHFASVCVNPAWTSLVAEQLKGSGVKTCTVISFPLGSETPKMKALEAGEVLELGTDEIDMVINIGAVKSGDYELVEEEIRSVVNVKKDAVLKVIIETCLLTDEEKIKVCQIAKKAGADFVKTSTGFSRGGAVAEDVALMRKTVGPDMGVKASGGIRTLEDAEKMLEAGASRIGASAGIKIISALS